MMEDHESAASAFSTRSAQVFKIKELAPIFEPAIYPVRFDVLEAFRVCTRCTAAALQQA